ncbi:MAG: hypothetical protein GY849_22030 [Deltaproteobacteria bacterium]|nr:hypothetical protein [Deltaproteobacteria bacterium]
MRKEKSIFGHHPLHLMVTIALVLCFAVILPASAAKTPVKITCHREGPDGALPGVYFFRLEPSFYTGFAPRCQDARRIHIHLGRGNQVRVTVVLSDHIINGYISDLAFRYRIYDALIRINRISLSQNVGFEKFKSHIDKEDVLGLDRRSATLDKEVYRKKNLEKLKKLNPGKLFHIKIDFEKKIRDWSAQLNSMDMKKASSSDILDLVNDMLPTRLTITDVSKEMRKRVHHIMNLHDQFEKTKDPNQWTDFYLAAKDLFHLVTEGIYSFKGNTLDFYEFTAIYPVGTLNAFAKFDGQKIPLYPCPGKRRLHVHQRTRVVDHVPDVACYGYLPWIPYMHVGKKLHNSFHTLWFNIDTRTNRFIPDEWKRNNRDSRSGKPYPHLWLVSRGPMSHGCTHVNAGHISELRQILPSKEEALLKVVTYRNKSNHFDVFDIDGDGNPEVMGVKYYYAYSLRDKKPDRMRAPCDRKSFYKWLYKKGYHEDKQGRVFFDEVIASDFRGKKAAKGRAYKNIPLYEADYAPETIQFYKSSSIPFVRELRRVSATYDLNRKTLKLERN